MPEACHLSETCTAVLLRFLIDSDRKDLQAIELESPVFAMICLAPAAGPKQRHVHASARVHRLAIVASTPRGLSPFGPRLSPSRAFTEDAKFELFPELNDKNAAKLCGVGRRSRMSSTHEEFFTTNSFLHRREPVLRGWIRGARGELVL